MNPAYAETGGNIAGSLFGAVITSVDAYDLMTVACLGIAEMAAVALVIWLLFFRNSRKAGPLFAGYFLVTAISAGMLIALAIYADRKPRHAQNEWSYRTSRGVAGGKTVACDRASQAGGILISGENI